jgi:Predicted oxidoreductases (related to aryl-alcohol dehydrogenases)
VIQLDQRQLGASDITVPALGVGTWSWGDKNFWGYGTTYTRDDIAAIYRFCLDNGLNFFDTAEIYGKGESERLLGACHRQDDRPIVIASKFAPLPPRFSADTLLDALDASLERLGVDTIDLYQIHFPNPLFKLHPLMDALAEAVRAGKVRAVGVSNFNEQQLRAAHARLARHDIPLASNQIHYSLLHRKPEQNGVLAACRELNISLIAYSPLEQGLLTGKYRAGNQNTQPEFPRRLQPIYRRSYIEKIEPLMQVLDAIAQAHDKTIGQVALNWLLEQDELIIPIPGAKTLRQAQENAGALHWRLRQAEYDHISRVAQC